MNIAIIIGVSNYVDSRNNLPGCKNDAEAINLIIKKTEKFENILFINDNQQSAKIKEQLTNFISENKGKSIEELFFYYTGHGEFQNDEFYYILSDFDPKKRNQTSLQNGEIDELFRTLNPELVIKIIDACQSGTTYIKESNVLSKYFTDTKKGFRKCYFLNSSLNNQSSYQDKNISFFTASFIKSLKEHSTNEIRYKDIIDVISDEFSSNNDQTPFFVIQADLTEKFCTFSKDLKEYLLTFNAKELPDTTPKEKPLTLAEIVKSKAKEYIDKEGALKSIEIIKKEIEQLKLNGDISELFKVDIEFLEENKTIPKLKVIGTWLTKNENDFFAKLVYEDAIDYDTGEQYTTMTGFDLKFETPFKGIKLEINSLFPNIVSYQANIVFLISRIHLRFFYFITNYVEESFDSKSLNVKDIKWFTNEVKISDQAAIKEAVLTLTATIEDRIRKDIENKFKPAEPPADDLPF
ncbi:caspase family protein [Ferruginibacter profundus]